MARQAGVVAREPRSPGRRLGQSVEHDPLRGVLRGELEQIAAPDPGHRHDIVVVHGTRVVAANQTGLQAGLRERQHLGRHRHLQGLEHRAEVASPAVVERQGGGARRQGLVQPRHGVADGTGGVADRRVIPRAAERPGALRHRRGQAGGEETHDDQKRSRDAHRSPTVAPPARGRLSPLVPALHL